ncbi:leukotriene A-4 hydrolase [Paraglaciecola mesophila KMM 241]|uniref:Aminopeptidase N n=1 Tax=Paraglaciecola mesophila KMM 241 TaxID=1128912 RepID=K6XWE5_9ALTE|nr:M1 family metallopeptidase [Paraglaciecola mesophila]GAC24939.1 leukotriene A-4 hydrolase [Paraglaciecola mesophila KMM 241]
MKSAILATTISAIFALSGCAGQGSSNQTNHTASSDTLTNVAVNIESGKDYHSFSNPEQISVTHLALDLDVNFDKKVISGDVQLTVKRMQEGNNTLVLDTRDLTIKGVTANGMPIPYSLGKEDSFLGAPLSITVPEGADKVTVSYQTSPQASGVQWLTPAQTAGKQHPFLFTQSQAIHARSFMPLQDSPQVRVTYDATVHTPKELLAVMSASNDPDTVRDGVYEFNMPQPIPAYLIALAVGDLKFKPMGKRTGVYAEPALLDAAADEFADTESMLEVTEKTYGPYRWDRYDLLILPPSFPFGGMENPRLSFITPTVIAGDKSLVSLIAHELAHSWSGNTVTNATWRDLWLNEGFTTYLTYRIMQMVYGDNRYNMEAVLGRQDLQADIDSLPADDEILAIDLRGRDPDAVFSNIPYEKGALFLRELEQKVGRDNFDQFLLNYFEHFAFQSITTDQFMAYLNDTLLNDYADKLSSERIHQWIFQPGIPQGAPVPHSNAFKIVDDARNQWLNGELQAKDIDAKDWVVHQWLYFLNNMPETLSQDQLAELDAVFDLTQSKNNEIAHSWLLMAVENWYEPALPRVHSYLVSIGRNKLVKPIYKALSQTPKGKVLAQKAFAEAKPGYHPLTVKANEGFVD